MEADTEIHAVSADFMQVCGPGVFMPKQVIISASTDNKHFTELTKIDYEVVKDDKVSFHNFAWEGKTNARYIRFQAKRSDFGGFLFTDEIIVK